MRLIESILKCYESRKTCSYEEFEIVNRGGKKFGVCPHCTFETPSLKRRAGLNEDSRGHLNHVNTSTAVFIYASVMVNVLFGITGGKPQLQSLRLGEIFVRIRT